MVVFNLMECLKVMLLPGLIKTLSLRHVTFKYNPLVKYKTEERDINDIMESNCF